MASDPSAYIKLSGSYATYIKSRSKNIRKNIQTCIKRLHKAGGSKFITATTPEEIKAALPDVKNLEQASWKNDSGVGAFSNRKRALFHCALAEALSENNHFILFLLKSEKGDILTYYYSFLYDGTLYLHNTAFDIKAKRYSPGIIGFLKVIEWAFERGLARVVIGRGGQYFKNAYRTDTTTRSWHFIFRNSLLMRLLAIVELKVLPWLRAKKTALSKNGINT